MWASWRASYSHCVNVKFLRGAEFGRANVRASESRPGGFSVAPMVLLPSIGGGQNLGFAKCGWAICTTSCSCFSGLRGIARCSPCVVGAILVEKGNIMGIAKNGPVGLPAIPFMLMCFFERGRIWCEKCGVSWISSCSHCACVKLLRGIAFGELQRWWCS